MLSTSLRSTVWIAWMVLAITSFIISAVAVSVLLETGMRIGTVPAMSMTMRLLVSNIMTYVSALALLLSFGRLFKMSLTRRELGVYWLKWQDIIIAIAAFVVYAFIGMVAIAVIKQLFPSLTLDQTQDLGFTSVYGLERGVAFVALVIVAPVVEEVLFRGILYGKLRSSGMNTVISALIVSVLFATAHGQLNVGIDVFILSIVLCMVREYTGSLGASIIVHMLKNAVAFYALFIVGAAAR